MRTLKDLVTEVEGLMTLSEDQVEEAVTSMIHRTKQYVKNCNLKSLVVGVSGGLDSAVVAAILNEENIGVPLIGLSIPMSSSDPHKEQAQWVGYNYCTAFEEFTGWEMPTNDYDDSQIYNMIDNTLSTTAYIAGQVGFDVEDFPHSLLRGNMKARLRMMTLYDLARKTNGMVLSTDNLSEYLAGFWTINGDVGDWGIIQNVWKGFELPQIAKYLEIREDIISQKPSDGLSVTEHDTDEAQLGMNYQEFDTIMCIHTSQYFNVPDDIYYRLAADMDAIVSDENESADKTKIVGAYARYKSTHFKRAGAINLSRDQLWT